MCVWMDGYTHVCVWVGCSRVRVLQLHFPGLQGTTSGPYDELRQTDIGLRSDYEVVGQGQSSRARSQAPHNTGGISFTL